MDTLDSMNEIMVQKNQSCLKKYLPIILLIISFVFIIIIFAILIHVSIQIKEKNDNTESKEEEEKEKGKIPIIGLTGMRLPKEGETINMTETHKTYDNVQIYYIEAVEKAGGTPITLPVLQTFNVETIKNQIEVVDGILIQGGLDVDPSFYNEGRDPLLGQTNVQTDKYLIEVIKQAHEKKIPILGICRGMQIVNVAFGGNLFQDLSNDGKDPSHHRLNDGEDVCSPKHSITILQNSLFAKIIPNQQTMQVNSRHHQSIDKLAANFEVDARADDNVIESIHYTGDDHWIFGVQFHPEQMLECGNEEIKPIFTEFINQAKKYKDSK